MEKKKQPISQAIKHIVKDKEECKCNKIGKRMAQNFNENETSTHNILTNLNNEERKNINK